MNRLVRLAVSRRRPNLYAFPRTFRVPQNRRYASRNSGPSRRETLESLYDEYIASIHASDPRQAPLSFEQFAQTVRQLEQNGALAEPEQQEDTSPLSDKYDDMLAALAQMEETMPNAEYQETLENLADSYREALEPSGIDPLFKYRLNRLDVTNGSMDDVAQRLTRLVSSTTDPLLLEQVENKLATYNGPLSTLNMAVEWYLDNQEAITVPDTPESQSSSSVDLSSSPISLDDSSKPVFDNNLYYSMETPVDELTRHLRNRDVEYAIQHRMTYEDREELVRLLESIIIPVFNEDMATFNAIADIFAKYEDVELSFHTEPRLPHVRRLNVFKRLLPRPDDEKPEDREKEKAEIQEIVAEVQRKEEIEEAERRAKEQPWPDLMTRDPLLDSRDVLELPPTKDSPYHNRVVIRNHQSIFTEALHADSFDFDNPDYEPTKTEDIEEQNNDERVNLPIPASKAEQLITFPVDFYMAKQQTGKGTIARIVHVLVVGDGKGMVGLGIGKHEKGEVAKAKAFRDAVRNMDWVERFENRTIWTEVRTKFGATTVILRPRPVGFGLRCNPYIHRLLKAAGIKDISAKVWGSRNRMGVMKATLRLLQAGHAPLGMGDGVGGPGRKSHKGTGLRSKSEIERERGRRLVDLRV
ncbi:37S ribosomal protein [Favolaschia claudopus]|uniref:37S ribosomal protein n=1 Tax=Favolaschia claudopus TaxID=2862362 RepID=A0AAW0CXA8_9AGAR